jgi:hypothetical protein
MILKSKRNHTILKKLTLILQGYSLVLGLPPGIKSIPGLSVISIFVAHFVVAR